MENPIYFYRGLAIALLIEVSFCFALGAVGWLVFKLLGR